MKSLSLGAIAAPHRDESNESREEDILTLSRTLRRPKGKHFHFDLSSDDISAPVIPRSSAAKGLSSPPFPLKSPGANVPLKTWNSHSFSVIDEHRTLRSGSMSLGRVFDNDTGVVYLAKGNYACPPDIQLREVFEEICSNDVYEYFGCSVQILGVCEDLPWIVPSNLWKRRDTGEFCQHEGPVESGLCTVSRRMHFVTECDGSHRINPTELCGRLVGPHVICLWMNEYKTLPRALLDQFVSTSHSERILELTVAVTLGEVEYNLPVRGIGNILAVALLIGDIDCIGGSCGNVMFSVVRDADTGTPLYAKAIKIDPGFGLKVWDDSVGYQQAVFNSIRRHEVTRFSGEPSGSRATFYCLPCSVQSEFIETLRHIVSATDREFRWLFARRGLEKLFTTPAVVQRYLEFVTARRDVLRESYAPHIVSDDVSDVARLLRAKYSQSVRIRDSVTDSQYDVDQWYVNVTILGKMVAQVGSRLTKTKESTFELADIAAKCEELGVTTRVNISGTAGTGKSTVCQRVVSSWAKCELFQKFQYVLWVPLRNLTIHRYPIGKKLFTVTDVVIQECLELQSSPLLRARVDAALADKDRVLWILDGYDEVAGRIPDHLLHAFYAMSWSNRILTGRPEVLQAYASDDRSLVCDLDLRITGLSDGSIREFVHNFVHSASATLTFDIESRRASIAAALLSSLRRTRAVWELAHTPAYLVFLCHVLHNELSASLFDEADGPFITVERRIALPHLFDRVEKLIWRRYCARVLKMVDLSKVSDDELRNLTRNEQLVLSEIAFDALKAGVSVLPAPVLAKHLRSTTCSVKDLLRTGVLVQSHAVSASDVAWMDSQYHFSHTAFMEYFAAKTAANLLSLPSHKSELRCEDMAWLFGNKDSAKLALTWQFTARELQCIATSVRPRSPASSQVVKVSTSCAVCHTSFGLFTSRFQCRDCGKSVCGAHRRDRQTSSPDTICTACVHPAYNAAAVLEGWWGDALTSTWFHSPEDSQIRLWLYFGEHACSLTACHAGFSDLLNVVIRHVRTDVLSMFRGKLNCDEVSWWSTLRDCPEMSKQVLFQWDEFNGFMASGAITPDLARLPYELADVVGDSPGLIAFMWRVWEASTIDPVDKVPIVNTIACCPLLTQLDVIVGEAIRSSVTALQDAAAACLVHKQYLLRDDGFIRACDEAYMTSSTLLTELQRLGDDHPWLSVLSNRGFCDGAAERPIQGRYLSKMQVASNSKAPGLAVSADESLVAVSNKDTHTVTVYVLAPVVDSDLSSDVDAPTPTVVTIGGHGHGPGQFSAPEKICFTGMGSLLVAESSGRRVQEVTLSGDHIHFIGTDTPGGLHRVTGIDCNEHVVVISHWPHSVDAVEAFKQVVVADYATGGYLRSFGEYGSTVGCLNQCSGLRLSRDGRHVIVAEALNNRVSIVTLAGAVVRCFGSSWDLNHPSDVCVAPSGEIIVAGGLNHNVVVFSRDGGAVLEEFGRQGNSNGEFQETAAVSYRNGKLYVLDFKTARVQVFE